MKRLTAFATAALVVLALAPAARAEFGVVPGSFLAKTHPSVPMTGPCTGGPFGCVVDVGAIEAAPPLTQAGAHPDASTYFALNPLESNPEQPREIRIETPPGFLGDPTGAVPCERPQFSNSVGADPGGCSPASQVGVTTLRIGSVFFSYPVFLLTPSAGSVATLGFQARGISILITPVVRTDGDFGLNIAATQITTTVNLNSAAVTLWGVPADPAHDPERWDPETFTWGASSPVAEEPFLLNPTWCGSGELTTALRMRSWRHPDRWLPENPLDPDYLAESPEPTGCDLLAFGGVKAPVALTMQPESRAAQTPSGYETRLTLPYNDDPKGLANPTLRDTVVTLPEGVRVNPASAAGLGACTSAQIGLTTAIGAVPVRFDKAWEGDAMCPDASKIGTVRVTTPLLDEPLDGGVYIAKQLDNPFGSMLAVYIAIDDPSRGLTVKLAGRVRTDPETGRVTASFTENPQLPFTEFALRFFGGPRAALVNPATCGTHTTTTELVPWSAPDTPPVTSTDSFQVSAGPNGSACAGSAAAQPNAPAFEAGTVTPIAGSYSPFVLHLARADGSQEIKGLDVTLPPGLSGRLAGIPYCPEAGIALARSREGHAGQGAVEQASPSCPAQSRVGSVDVAAGAGPSPLHVPGTAYLAGPYKGGPVSLVIVSPAVAGPFDLGVVVVRSALHVDPATARIRAISDPIPHVLEVEGNGFPLNVRSVDLVMDRPDFTLNPTSCREMGIGGSALSVLGQSAPLFDRFQVGACRALEFKPRLRIRLKGGTKRGKNPKLISTVTYPKGSYANIARASVKLPRSAFLDQSHIGTVCTRVQFAADACPPGSVYGRASARSPLLDYKLAGKVYLRSSSNLLPDLVADLRGPAHQPVRIELVGRTDAVKGALRNTFAAVPDAPVSRFRLELFGGKRGLVVNSTNLCRGKNRANVKLDAHNGKTHDTRPLVRVDCGKKKRARSSRHDRAR